MVEMSGEELAKYRKATLDTLAESKSLIEGLVREVERSGPRGVIKWLLMDAWLSGDGLSVNDVFDHNEFFELEEVMKDAYER